MKKSSKIIWGIFLILIGILIGCKSLGILDINIFFDGWWTLFIIIPSAIGLINDEDKTGSIIGLLIGVVLLLGCRNVLDFDTIGKLIFPAILVVLGLSLIFKTFVKKDFDKDIKKLNEKLDSKEGYTATFSGQDINLNGEEFNGTNLNAIFGGIKLDLRKSTIKEDVVINATSIFGGIDIFVPEGFKVKVKSNSIFGGVSNDKKYDVDDKSHTIFINATCMFGGVEIK